jgi:hypothetical protein
MKRLFFALLMALTSATGFSCPDGEYEICAIPRPWGGCAQKACVPNGGKLTGGAANALADLNRGIIRVGDQIVSTSAAAGRGLANIANRVDDINFSKVDWNSVALAATAIYYGGVCIASSGAAPGGPTPAGGGVLDCSVNSCACSAVAAVMLIKNRTNMSDGDRAQLQAIADNPTFDAAVRTPQTLAEAQKQLASMGLLKPVKNDFDPRPTCPRCIPR